VFSAIRRGVTPELNAISSLMLLASTVLVLGSLFLQREPKSKTNNQGE
jgi:spermidine/putrescine transport system permease protein